MPLWTKEQELAINQDHTNIIVSAGAGSGKTAVLSERVIRKLKDGCNINELLILTFTKAAALEMKERIRKKISNEAALTNQLEIIDSAYITTFDSYALTIVKKYNYLLNVDRNISIVDTNIINIEKQKIMDSIFEELYHSQDVKFLQLIKDFCAKDDQKIKKYILDINLKLDMNYNKEEYLAKYIETYFNDDFINKKIQEYENLLLLKIEKINANVLSLLEFVDSDYEYLLQNAIGELLIANDYNQIKSNLNLLPRLPKNTMEEAKKYKEKITETIKELMELCSYENKNEIKESIYKTKNYVETIISIIKKLDYRLKFYKNDHDLFEFNDIIHMAIKVVDKHLEIREEIKQSFKEIMIDEYQDTNDLQDKFISLIENNNVYMVGDIKQSIYRFRNANPLLFKLKYDKYSLNEGGIKIDLNKNFRSREEVLNNINLIFNQIMDDFLGGAAYKHSHQMIYGNQIYNLEGKIEHSNDFEILTYSYNKQDNFSKEEIEIFTIANDIKEKLKNNYLIFDKDQNIKRPLKYEDIVILMDRSTNFSLYKKIFEYLNIPLSIYKDESISDSVDIFIIKNIIKLILNNKINQDYKYAFISIARSFLVNYKDEDIARYFVNNNFEEDNILKIIRSINYQEMNIQEILEEIINKFEIYSKLVLIGNINKHMAIYEYLLNQASELNNMGYTLEDFYNYLNTLEEQNCEITIPVIESNNGVKIMTIHKSKGLEYHICYYSGLYAKFNLSELKERFIYDEDFGIITPIIDCGIRNTIYKELVKHKYNHEEISEKIRLFYVALTRAKEKMILIMPENNDKPSKLTDERRLQYNSFMNILNSIKGSLSKYISKIKVDEIGLTKDYNYLKKYNFYEKIKENKNTILVKELNIENNQIEECQFSKNNHKLLTLEEQENMLFGIKMHEIFQNIDFYNPDYTTLNDLEKKKVKQFLESNILNNVINIYKEYEFSYSKNNILYHGVIDLLLEYHDCYKIIDYKLLNTKDDAYKKQLKGYKEYIEQLTEKKVQIYLYSILNETLEQIKI